MKNKRIGHILLAALLLFTLAFTACSKETDATVVFCARAAVALSRNMNDNTARSFQISYIEYERDGEMQKVKMKCAYNHTDNTFSQHIIVAGAGGDYFDDVRNSGTGVYDELTGLYVIDCGDVPLLEYEDRKVDTKQVTQIYSKFMKSDEDLSILGIGG